jgi:hypothetical protein
VITSATSRTRKLRQAVLAHVLLSPWWLVCWAIAAGLASSYQSPDSPSVAGASLPPQVWVGLALYGVGAGLWVKLLTDLSRWGREGRDVSWKYPALWAGVTFFNISFAIAFLFPGVRRALAPPPAEVWRLHNGAGRTQSCELRNNEQGGGGWDVLRLEDGEPRFSQHYGSEAEARLVVESFRQDLVRTGWVNLS